MSKNITVDGIQQPSQDFACLEVRDTGEGINPEVLAHLFEPFFTTKKEGKGTGLGLASSHGIIQQFRGTIEVESKLGKGSVFRVLLPHVKASISSASQPEMPASQTGGTGEKVLLIEDNPDLQNLLMPLLLGNGYRAVLAKNGQEGLEKAAAHEFDLIVSDIIMPKVNGVALYDQLRGLTRFMFISGFIDEVGFLDRLQEDGVPFLQKPFSPSLFLEKVAEVLDK